jgi:hypothetical protein
MRHHATRVPALVPACSGLVGTAESQPFNPHPSSHALKECTRQAEVIATHPCHPLPCLRGALTRRTCSLRLSLSLGLCARYDSPGVTASSTSCSAPPLSAYRSAALSAAAWSSPCQVQTDRRSLSVWLHDVAAQRGECQAAPWKRAVSNNTPTAQVEHRLRACSVASRVSRAQSLWRSSHTGDGDARLR